MSTWPEFLYGGLTIDEYVHLVQEEDRDVKEEVVALVCHLRDTNENRSAISNAIFSLLELLE